jgi:hypothetical protein
MVANPKATIIWFAIRKAGQMCEIKKDCDLTKKDL